LKAIERLRFLLLLRKEMEARFCQIVERERERVWEVGLSFECKRRGFQFNHFFFFQGERGRKLKISRITNVSAIFLNSIVTILYSLRDLNLDFLHIKEYYGTPLSTLTFGGS
jgi:hypothetical protein